MSQKNIQEIEQRCQELNFLRGQLRKRFEARQAAISTIESQHNPSIRELQEECAQLRADLVTAITNARQDFEKPKTRSFFGIVVGFEKERDKLELPEDSVLVDRIEKLLPSKQAETLLDRTVTVIKTAFKKLPLADLQKLGCRKVVGADQPVVRPEDDDIEALVQKSLGDAATQSKAE